MACSASAGSITLSSGICVCPAGYFLPSNGSCTSFVPKEPDGSSAPEVSTFTFVPPISTNGYNIPASTAQVVFTVLTIVLLSIWLGGTILLRFMPLRGVWFRLRWFVTVVDYAFSKKHWNDEQKALVKRKTELGGSLSIAAFIYIIGVGLGIFAQFLTGAQITLQSILPTSGNDVAEITSDLDFNITTISSMKCSQLVYYDEITMNDSILAVRSLSLSGIANTSCHDTPSGPMVRMQCNQCQVAHDDYVTLWEFVDRPELGLVASAVGFEFSVRTASANGKRASTVTGSLQAGSNGTAVANATLRGADPTVIDFRYIPRLFQGENLKFLQVTFHEYVTGSYASNSTELQAALSSPDSVKVTLHLQVLSAYIVKTTVIPSIGILTLLSKIGGIYQVGTLFFFMILHLAEANLKYLRYDDKLLYRLERQRVARYHWHKVRVAVRYGLVTGNAFRTASFTDSPSPPSPGTSAPPPSAYPSSRNEPDALPASLLSRLKTMPREDAELLKRSLSSFNKANDNGTSLRAAPGAERGKRPSWWGSLFGNPGPVVGGEDEKGGGGGDVSQEPGGLLAAGVGGIKGVFRDRRGPREAFEVSASMEKRAADEIRKDYPGVEVQRPGLREVKVDIDEGHSHTSPSALPSAATEQNKDAHPTPAPQSKSAEAVARGVDHMRHHLVEGTKLGEMAVGAIGGMIATAGGSVARESVRLGKMLSLPVAAHVPLSFGVRSTSAKEESNADRGQVDDGEGQQLRSRSIGSALEVKLPRTVGWVEEEGEGEESCKEEKDELAGAVCEVKKRLRKRKKVKSHQDSRLGSMSEHQGTAVHKIREPSWIPEYETLPHVPDPGEEDRQRRRERRRQRRRREKIEAAGGAAGTMGAFDGLADKMNEERDEEGSGQPGKGTRWPPPSPSSSSSSPSSSSSDESEQSEVLPLDIYNYLVDLNEYQERFRTEFLLAESMLENVVQRLRPHSDL